MKSESIKFSANSHVPGLTCHGFCPTPMSPVSLGVTCSNLQILRPGACGAAAGLQRLCTTESMQKKTMQGRRKLYRMRLCSVPFADHCNKNSSSFPAACIAYIYVDLFDTQPWALPNKSDVCYVESL